MVGNGAVFTNSVISKEMPEMGGGMGLCSTKDLEIGDDLCSVPTKLLFTTRVARAHPAFNHIIAKDMKALQILPLFLFHESLDTTSFWYPWVSRLPRHYDTLVECPEELHEQFVCKRRLEKVVKEKAELKALYLEALSMMEKAGLPKVGGKVTEEMVKRVEAVRGITLAEFTGFYCSVMSRGFYYDIDSARHDVWAMIPWLDYFNYTDSAGHHAGFDVATQTFCITANGPITAGDQILLHYGTYSNFELLMWYGFVLQSNRNLEYKFSPTAGMFEREGEREVNSLLN